MQFNKSLFVLSLISFIFLSSSALALQSGDFTYTVSSNTVTITDYTGSGGAVIIPANITGMPVVGIAYGAFGGINFITSVKIPGSVSSIGNFAFSGCTGLTSITVDASNANYSSQDGVLYNNDKSILIQFPCGKSGGLIILDSVTSIGFCAFQDCTGLTSVTIPGSVKSIDSQAFEGCTGLTDITIPDSITMIEVSTFQGCIGLTNLTIPGSITMIDNDAFQGCTGLTSVTIPGSVTSIMLQAFSGCTKLTAVYFYGNAPAMGSSVFEGCASGFTVYYLDGCMGFKNPWYGYPTVRLDLSETTTTTSQPTTTTTQPTTTTTVSGAPCPATQVLGADSPQLENLRIFRDGNLAQSSIGRKVIQIYYNNADSINAALDYSPALRACARKFIDIVALRMGSKD